MPRSQAEHLLWDLDDTGGDDRRWRHEILERIPLDFAQSAASIYQKLWQSGNHFAANRGLRRTAESVSTRDARLARDNDALLQFVRNRTLEAQRMRRQYANDEQAMVALTRFAQSHGVTAPSSPKPYTAKQVVARLCDETWWRRAVRKTVGRRVEHAAIKNNMVNRRKALYVSDGTLERRRMQKRRNQTLLESLMAENEFGYTATLHEIASHSVSNPANRHAELMTRTGGCEAYSQAHGHSAVFITATCPSRFHASPAASCEPNLKYAGASPRDAQQYLTKYWGRIRTAFQRKGLRLYGLRIAEPHHDGTVHWHLLVFGSPADLATFEALCRHHWLTEDAHELGATEHRVKVVTVDPARGSAAGYIAKYVSKNIDGRNVGADLEDAQHRDAASTAERVEAWASVWGIRQFQFFGTPSVTVWRELRRLREPVEPTIEPFRLAADQADWVGYMRLMESIGPVQLVKAWSDAPGRYEEAKGWQIIGVILDDTTVSTRPHSWTIKRAPIEESIVPYTEIPPYTETLRDLDPDISTKYNETTSRNGIIIAGGTCVPYLLDLFSLESCQ